jgi:hypothetical protein
MIGMVGDKTDAFVLVFVPQIAREKAAGFLALSLHAVC